VLRYCLQVEDAITEALENDNLQLQNMSGQKYVQLNPMFLDAVANWQKKLGTVDSVLATWTDVQKKWQALESIFVGSADIRVQLPDDSKRFDVINADYQVRGLRHHCWIMACSCDVTAPDGFSFAALCTWL
jgi:dynein heavy chain